MADLIISSNANQYIKLARSLADKKGRRASGLFLAEGLANIREALAAGIKPQLLLYAAGSEERPEALRLLQSAQAQGARLLAVEPQLLARLSPTATSQGLLLLLLQPQMNAAEFAARAPGRSIAVLDGLQDPGNVGTILRTAWAAGLGGVLLVNDCADVYSPKVVRAAMGALYWLPVLALPNDEAWQLVRRLDCQLICADANGQDFRQLGLERPAAWLLGREACGPSQFWRSRAESQAAIPLQPGVDSLNVAVAAGILFFSATK